METVFPEQPGFSGLFLVAYRRTPPGNGAVQKVGCAIVKRAYRIDGSSLVPDGAGEGIRFVDEVQEEELDGKDVPIVRRESDLAPYKPESDLVVLGFHAADGSGSVTVGGTTWFRRSAGSNAADDSDSIRNLFGWEQRTRFGREGDAGTFSDDPNDYPAEWPIPADPPELPGFSNRFFNGYRRRFKVFGGSLPAFQPGVDVSVTGAGGSTVDLTLGPERIGGQIHYWCARGPDRPTYWCELPLDEFTADTLVLEPDAGRAFRIWRGVWPMDVAGEPTIEAYRRLVVTAEGV